MLLHKYNDLQVLVCEGVEHFLNKYNDLQVFVSESVEHFLNKYNDLQVFVSEGVEHFLALKLHEFSVDGIHDVLPVINHLSCVPYHLRTEFRIRLGEKKLKAK
jgi:hypothetical protein